MSRAKRRATPKTEESAAWWTIGGPCAVVIGMLLLGAVLRSPADGSQPVDTVNDGHHDLANLAERSVGDSRRLEGHRDEWTLQFMVACDRRTLEPIVAALDNQPAFFLLRHPGFGGDCYRVCWGTYESKSEAEHPRAYPETLSNVKAIPWALPVANALP